MGRSGVVLVVCTGNVCRSAYLQQRLAGALRDAGSDVRVESAGTRALAGHCMDPIMAGFLGDEADATFRARQVTPEMIAGADLVLTATRAHRTTITQLLPRALRTTFVAADFAYLARQLPGDEMDMSDTLADRVLGVARQRAVVAPVPASEADVVDPIGRPLAVYRKAVGHLDRLVPNLLRVIA